MSCLRQSHHVARLALVLLALVALCAQQWVARAHWHAPADIAAGLHGLSLSATGEAPLDGGGLPHPDCLLCHAASHAGSAAPPSEWALQVVHIELPQHRPSAGVPATVPSPAAWAWHSRGPPAASIEPSV
jgi:hypothetical protein